MLVRPIDALLPRASRNFGSKARNLAALVRAGFPVPAAYALSCEAAAQTFTRALPPSLRPSQIFARARVSQRDLEEARARVLAAELSAEIEQELVHAFEVLRAASVLSLAVRSSSTSEDAGAASAAGVLTAVLNVRSEAALFDAVRACMAQVFSPRVSSYLQSLGPQAVGEMAIVIQAMVPADVSGVLFTTNPLSGDPEEMVIDASYGLGTNAGDERATPDTYRIHKPTGWVRDRVLGDKRLRTVAAPQGGLRDEPVPAALAQKQALDEHMLAQLITLGRRVEQHFGDAREIEFAIAADSIYLLQARPVTISAASSVRSRGRRRARMADDPSTVLWSNLDVRDALPGVATPLTWSLLSSLSQTAFFEAFASVGCKVPADVKLVGNFRGRIYLNRSGLTQIAAQVPGLKPSLLLARGGAEMERIEREGRPGSPAGFLLRLPVIAARFTRANLGFGRRVLELDTAFAAECARIEAIDFRILSASGLDETLSDVYRLLERSGQMLLTAYAGVLATLVPLRAALDLLCGGRASEVQSALLSAVEAEQGVGAEAPSERTNTDAMMASVPFPARSPLRVLLAAVRSYVRLRERLRSRLVRELGLLRLVASDASRRLAVREPEIQKDAAFFLTIDELHGVLRGEIRTAASLVRTRWLQYQRDCGLPEPPATFVGYPPPPEPTSAPRSNPDVGERGRVRDELRNAQRLRP